MSKVAEIVTEKILAALDSGVVPWRQTWAMTNSHRGVVRNYAYRGVNVLLLAISQHTEGYEYPLWLSLKDAKKLGVRIRQDELKKSHIVTYFKRLKIEEKDASNRTVEKTIPLLRYYRVWNIDQLETYVDCSLIQKRVAACNSARNTDSPNDAAAAIIAGYPDAPEIRHLGDQPSYSVTMDVVTLPKFENFDSAEDYYAAAFHELSHSTGHESRVGRDLSGAFGTPKYAKEELIAEISAAMLIHESGMEDVWNEQNTAAYIESWRSRISRDPKLIVSAASGAEFAARTILGDTATTDAGETDSPATAAADIVAPGDKIQA